MNKDDKKKKNEPRFIEKAEMEKIIGNDEVLEWYKLTPAERFAESQKLREIFILFGGSYDDGVDTQSPFNIFKK